MNRVGNICKALLLPLAGVCLVCTPAFAQTVNVNPATEFQTIRGFGGMNAPGWVADLTPAQVDTAFGNDTGQLGLSIMRMRIDPNPSRWNIQVPAAVQAKSHGAILLASPWSPPAFMKSNNNLNNGGKLLPQYYGDYTTHLLDFAEHMSRNGAPLYAMSVQNEPDWHPDYESCDWSPGDFVNYLNAEGSRFGSLKVVASESLNFNPAYTDPILNSSTANPHLDIVGGHLYGKQPVDYPLARSKGKELWMTEHYTESANSANAWPLALDVGTELHRSMVANYNAYIWWYIRRSYGLITEDSKVSKRGFIMAQYAKYVRPGFKRIGATEKPYADVFVTAYKGPDNKLVLVVVNNGSAQRNLLINLQNGSAGSLVKYSTSEVLDLGYGGTYNLSGGSTSVWVEPKSVATLVSDGSGGPSSSSASVRSSSSFSLSSSFSSSSSSSSSSQRNLGSSSSPSSSASNPTASATCSYVVTNQWNNGYTAAIRIHNTGSRVINGWTVNWSYADANRISNSWNATLSGSNPYSASALSWNANIHPGQSVEFGFQGTKGAAAASIPLVTGSICR